MSSVQNLLGPPVIRLSELKHGGTKSTETHGGVDRLLPIACLDRAGVVWAGSEAGGTEPSVRLRVLRASVLQLTQTRSQAPTHSRQNFRRFA
jgi:hypothetical protein